MESHQHLHSIGILDWSFPLLFFSCMHSHSQKYLLPSFSVFHVILPSKDAADVWDEPLSRVESQNPDAAVPLQPQLKKKVTCIFNGAAAQSLRYSWPTSHLKSCFTGHGRDIGEVTGAVDFTHPGVSFQQAVLTTWRRHGDMFISTQITQTRRQEWRVMRPCL